MKKFLTSSAFVWIVLVVMAVFLFPAGAVLAAEPTSSDGLNMAWPMLGVAGFIDLFDSRTMLSAVEQIKRPGTFLRDMFFPLQNQSDTETVDVDIIKGKRRMAPFVSPMAEGKLVEGQGFSTSTIKPGYVKPKMVTTAQDLMTRSAGNVLYAGQQTVEQRAQAKLGKDLATLMDMVTRREEWQAAQALNLGQVVMKIKAETGDKTVTVDFNMPATHKITLAGLDLWSDTANSNPIAKLRAWAQLIGKDSGLSPNTLVLGSDAAQAFIDHPKVQKILDMRAVDMGAINPQQLPEGVSYVGRINAPGLFVDVYSYDEWYIDDDTAVETPMVPVNKVWLGTSKAQNTQLHAVIQDVEAIEGGLAAVSRFPKSWITKDPAVRWLMMQSAPLMALNQPDAFVSAQVLA